jgi:3-dehydroquinate dehydratase II
MTVSSGLKPADALRALAQALRGGRSDTHTWRLCLIDGPNMSNLGVGRDPRNFGVTPSLDALHECTRAFAEGMGATMRTFASNHEGALVEYIYAQASETDVFLFNPAGLSKYGVPSAQALDDSGVPYVELHFANTAALGWSQGTVLTRGASACVMGLRNHSYVAAVFGIIGALDDGTLGHAPRRNAAFD